VELPKAETMWTVEHPYPKTGADICSHSFRWLYDTDNTGTLRMDSLELSNATDLASALLCRGFGEIVGSAASGRTRAKEIRTISTSDFPG
jgi:hypothetical protein